MEWEFPRVSLYHVETAPSRGFGPRKFQLTFLFWHLSGKARLGML